MKTQKCRNANFIFYQLIVIFCIFIVFFTFFSSQPTYAISCPRPNSDASSVYDPQANQCWSWGDIGWNVDGTYQACGPVKCPNGSGSGSYGNTCITQDCHAGYGATGYAVPGCIPEDPSTSIICPETDDFMVKVVDQATGKPLPNIQIKFHYADNPPGNTTGTDKILTTDSSGAITLSGNCGDCKYSGTKSFLYPGDHVILTPITNGYSYSPIQIGDNSNWKKLNGGANIEMNTTWSCGTIVEAVTTNTSYKNAHSAYWNSACLFKAQANATPTPTPTPTPQPVGISGTVYVDTNNNQHFDSGENAYTGGTSTISFSGPTSKIVQTTNGVYSTGASLLPGTYTVSYTSLPTGYYLTYPLNGPPPSFIVTVGPSCSTNGINDASCTNGSIVGLNVGITNATSWIQGSCSDMRIDSGFTDNIPQGGTCGGTPSSYAITTNNLCPSAPGIVFSGKNPSNFGQGQASQNPYNWVVGGTTYGETFQHANLPFLRTSYNYMAQTASQSGITPIDLSTVCSLSNCTLPPNLANGLYQANGIVYLNGYTFSSNKAYVFLINGDLYIDGNITIPSFQGSSAIFSTSGNIYVDKSVGVPPTSTMSNIDGLYSTDKSFIIQSTGTCSDQRLNISGSVVVNAALAGGSFQNNRNLCSMNSVCPAVSVSERADLLLYMPDFVKHVFSLWKEIMP